MTASGEKLVIKKKTRWNNFTVMWAKKYIPVLYL
jgi:hypothetical protein